MDALELVDTNHFGDIHHGIGKKPIDFPLINFPISYLRKSKLFLLDSGDPIDSLH